MPHFRRDIYKLENIQKKGTRMQILLKAIPFKVKNVEGTKHRVGKSIYDGEEALESVGHTIRTHL